MQDVFARIDGLVTDIHVQHGQHVAADQLLATLRRPQLDFEFKQVLGELQTSRKRLAAIEAERVQTPRDNDEQRRQYGLLAAQGEEVRELIRSLEAQHEILRQKQKDLEVRSPMAGEILTWNVEQLLSARPVDRGQALMTVGNLSGPWQLELHVPDRQIAHVLAAQRELGQQLEVGYLLGTAPTVKLHGTVREVVLRTEVPDGDAPYVQVFVDVDRSELPELVPALASSPRFVAVAAQPGMYGCTIFSMQFEPRGFSEKGERDVAACLRNIRPCRGGNCCRLCRRTR